MPTETIRNNFPIPRIWIIFLCQRGGGESGENFLDWAHSFPWNISCECPGHQSSEDIQNEKIRANSFCRLGQRVQINLLFLVNILFCLKYFYRNFPVLVGNLFSHRGESERRKSEVLLVIFGELQSRRTEWFLLSTFDHNFDAFRRVAKNRK